MKGNNNALILGISIFLVIAIVLSTSESFTLFSGDGCGIVGTLNFYGSLSTAKMCLPNGQWSGWLDCSEGKCGIRQTTNIPGYCNWLDLKCVNNHVYMCGRNYVFSDIGKINGYCGYNSNNPNPPLINPTSNQIYVCGETYTGNERSVTKPVYCAVESGSPILQNQQSSSLQFSSDYCDGSIEDKCVDTFSYSCINDAWANMGEINGYCGYVGETQPNINYNFLNEVAFTLGTIEVTWLYLIIAGGVLLLIIILIK